MYSKSTSYISISDFFCGAGGSSLGAQAAGGEIILALNHWMLAVETHNSNFPETLHDCTDISACDPRRYPSSTILLASPECVNHSQAKGKKRKNQAQLRLWEPPKIDPAADRSRATMFDVPRFAEAMQSRGQSYQIIIVENVVECRDWIFFDEWLAMMHKLDYLHTIVYFNSQFAPPMPTPVPQSRDRMYIVFWRRGNPAPDLAFRPKAFCFTCDKNVESVQSWKDPTKKHGRYGKYGQYVYRCPSCASEVTPYFFAASTAVDWGIPATRIKDRSKPLKPKTLRRIQMGLERFACDAWLVDLSHASAKSGYVRSIFDAYPTQTTAQSIGLAMPFLVALDHTNAQANHIYPVSRAWPTQTARQDKALIVPPYLIEFYGTGTVRSINEPLSTVTAQGNHHGVVLPPGALAAFLATYYKQVSLQAMDAVPEISSATERLAPCSVQDCYFRMLLPHEIGRAMAFPDEYVVLGNAREKTRMYGNAVTPPVMRLLVERCIKTLA